MVEEIYELKNKLLEQLMKDVGERGIERIDGDMVDMVKDLAEAEKSCWEAEYYRSVAEAMERGTGYGAQMGYGGMYGYSGNNYASGNNGGSQSVSDGSGYRDSMGRYARRGYGESYREHIEALKMEMQNADPKTREQMTQELKGIM